MSFLIEQGILPLTRVRVVGLIHTDETEDYSSARDYIAAKNLPWLTLKEIACPLKPDTLFERNACTPVFEELVAEAAGIVFFGGPDLPPVLYGQKTHLLTGIRASTRHYYEGSLLYHLLGREAGDPPLLERHPTFAVLAICLGMQTMNVATGGTLLQDIPSQIYGVHTVEDMLEQPPDQIHINPYFMLNPAPGVAWAVFHPIELTDDSPLEDLAGGAEVEVFSAHHQAIDRLGHGLRVAARSTDGRIVEAVVHERFPSVLGIQFHPDFLALWDEGIPFAVRAEAPTGNVAAKKWAADTASLRLTRGVWQWLAQQLEP